MVSGGACFWPPRRKCVNCVRKIGIATGSAETVDSKTAELADAGYRVASGPRTTGDGYDESSIIGPEGIQIEITV